MAHAYHGDLKGIVLYDGCMACENRTEKLWEIDPDNLRRLAALDRFGSGHESYADRKALETLQVYARIVAASGIEVG